MRGTVLGYDLTSHTGAISGHDGNRYDFALSEWKSPGRPLKGQLIDFVAADNRATAIYVVEATSSGREGWFSFLFSSDGRIPRKRYWLAYVLPVFGIYFVAGMIDAILGAGRPREATVNAVTMLVSLFFLWPSFAISAKRLHDRGMSGWWAALANSGILFIVLAGAAYWYYTTKLSADGTTREPADPATALILMALFLAVIITWIFFTIQIGFIRGQVGTNRYGDDPLTTPEDVRSDGIVTAIFGSIVVFVFLLLPASAYWYYTTKMKAQEAIEQPSTESDPAITTAPVN